MSNQSRRDKDGRDSRHVNPKAEKKQDDIPIQLPYPEVAFITGGVFPWPSTVSKGKYNNNAHFLIIG